eukprot:1139994-Pelagomonas_calceolata.AAC.3
MAYMCGAWSFVMPDCAPLAVLDCLLLAHALVYCCCAGISGVAIAGSRSQQPKPKMGISVQALQRAMHRGQSEMQNYLNVSRLLPVCASHLSLDAFWYVQELNLREREIFTELINLGVDENSSDLSEVHKHADALQSLMSLKAHTHASGKTRESCVSKCEEGSVF